MNNLPEKADKTDAIEAALVVGDLSKLSAEQRVMLYAKTCESLGMNHLTKPFDYLQLNGKLVLYANRSASDQLRKINGVSIQKLERKIDAGICYVDCYVTDKSGRSDVSTGAVALSGLTGEKLANAVMKAETKAKRRATLSICGLGWLDETEVETIPNAWPVKEAQNYSLPAEIKEEKPEPNPHYGEIPHSIVPPRYYVTDKIAPDKLEEAKKTLQAAKANYDADTRVWIAPYAIKKMINHEITEAEAIARGSEAESKKAEAA